MDYLKSRFFDAQDTSRYRLLLQTVLPDLAALLHTNGFLRAYCIAQSRRSITDCTKIIGLTKALFQTTSIGSEQILEHPSKSASGTFQRHWLLERIRPSDRRERLRQIAENMVNVYLRLSPVLDGPKYPDTASLWGGAMF
jgi:hypothetical protein